MKNKKERVYKGMTIYKAERNSSGVRWYTFAGERVIRSTTLIGIKKLISKLS